MIAHSRHFFKIRNLFLSKRPARFHHRLHAASPTQPNPTSLAPPTSSRPPPALTFAPSSSNSMYSEAALRPSGSDRPSSRRVRHRGARGAGSLPHTAVSLPIRAPAIPCYRYSNYGKASGSDGSGRGEWGGGDSGLQAPGGKGKTRSHITSDLHSNPGLPPPHRRRGPSDAMRDAD